MKTKLLFLLFLISIALTACSSNPYAYSYPKEYSAEYCLGQYELFDPNIAYSECYDLVSKKNWGLTDASNFAAIRDCDDLSFMVYYQESHFFGSGYKTQVVRKNDNDTNPATDFTPLRAELIWYQYDNAAEESKQYHDYEEQHLSKTAMVIDNEKAVEEVMSIAARDTVLSREAYMREDKATIDSSKLKDISNGDRPWNIQTNVGTLYVKVTFSECPGLMLVGKLFVDENGYSYMEHLVYYYNSEQENASDVLKLTGSYNMDGGTLCLYYRLGENMDALIRQVSLIESAESSDLGK